MILELNEKLETGENESLERSEYKSGNENEVGIYFFDPTANKEKK